MQLFIILRELRNRRSTLNSRIRVLKSFLKNILIQYLNFRDKASEKNLEFSTLFKCSISLCDMLKIRTNKSYICREYFVYKRNECRFDGFVLWTYYLPC